MGPVQEFAVAVTEKVIVSTVFPTLLIPLNTGKFPEPLAGKPVTLFELDWVVQVKVDPMTPLDQFTGMVLCPEQMD